MNIYSLLFMRSDRDIFYSIVLNFENCIVYFICPKELFGDISLPYMGGESKWLEVVILPKDVLRDLEMK